MDNNSIIRFFDADRFAALCGAKLIDVSQGKAVARLDIGPEHMNAAGGVQGGAIFTLCDFAFAAAINSHGSLTVGANASIQYFKAPRGGYITAIAGEISRGHRLCGCTVDVFDEDGTLIARYTGTGYIKSEKLKFE